MPFSAIARLISIGALFTGLLACGSGGTANVEGTLPCDSLEIDFYRVETGGGSSLRVVVDTVDPATTFDPVFGVRSVLTWADAPADVDVEYELAWADENFPCTHAPTSGECPQATVNLTNGDSDFAQEDVLVIVSAEKGACAGADAGYELRVELDGSPGDATYLGQANLFDTDL
jgi:hypothetical protein